MPEAAWSTEQFLKKIFFRFSCIAKRSAGDEVVPKAAGKFIDLKKAPKIGTHHIFKNDIAYSLQTTDVLI